MGDAQRALDLDAPVGVRARGSARRRGDHHARAVSVVRVTVYHAAGCHLCERAQGQLARLQGELGFDLEEIDITGDPDLEGRYREWLPVIEIDGRRAFVYYLDEDAFRRKLSQA